MSFLIQPFARVSASTDVVPIIETETTDIIPDVPWEPAEIDVVLTDDSLIDSTEGLQHLTEIEPTVTTESHSSTTDASAPGSDMPDLPQAPIVTEELADVLSPSATTTDSTTSIQSGVIGEETINSTLPVDLLSEDVEPYETPLSVSVSYAEASFQFGRDACVQVADGSFYCQQPTQTNDNQVRTDGIYALPDNDGDLEIYIQKDGELTQITQNTVDDASPYYDQISNTIVWHRLINDRYQIIVYDIDSGTEQQLTSGNANNMEPVRAGNYTAWQYWGTAWDIVLSDGKQMKRLTESDSHDVAPSIRNGLVVWQRMHQDGTRTIKLYDIKTGEYHSITDTEGGTISNPRMVVVYESTNAAGDIVTRGYDIITGEVSTLGTLPVPLPERIPEPNETGETVALVHAKSNAKDEQEEHDLDLENQSTGSTSLAVSEFDLVIGTTTDPVSITGELPAHSTFDAESTMTLDLQSLSSDTTTASDNHAAADAAFTLIVPQYTDVVTTPTSAVAD